MLVQMYQWEAVAPRHGIQRSCCITVNHDYAFFAIPVLNNFDKYLQLLEEKELTTPTDSYSKTCYHNYPIYRPQVLIFILSLAFGVISVLLKCKMPWGLCHQIPASEIDHHDLPPSLQITCNTGDQVSSYTATPLEVTVPLILPCSVT